MYSQHGNKKKWGGVAWEGIYIDKGILIYVQDETKVAIWHSHKGGIKEPKRTGRLQIGVERQGQAKGPAQWEVSIVCGERLWSETRKRWELGVQKGWRIREQKGWGAWRGVRKKGEVG